uniref:Uncharacterized protein n=1 Tax=Arundo donax TaxID=35708 RepID=A0A0A9DE69_ARUDO
MHHCRGCCLEKKGNLRISLNQFCCKIALGTAGSYENIGPLSLGFWARKNQEQWRVVGIVLLQSVFCGFREI